MLSIWSSEKGKTTETVKGSVVVSGLVGVGKERWIGRHKGSLGCETICLIL